MAEPHDWRDCYPVVTALRAGNPDEAAALTAKAQEMFVELAESERRAYHQFCCLSVHSETNREIVVRFTEAVLAARGG